MTLRLCVVIFITGLTACTREPVKAPSDSQSLHSASGVAQTSPLSESQACNVAPDAVSEVEQRRAGSQSPRQPTGDQNDLQSIRRAAVADDLL